MFKLINVAVSEYGENVLGCSFPESLPAVHIVRQISAHVRQMGVFALVEIPRFDLILILLLLFFLPQVVDAASPARRMKRFAYDIWWLLLLRLPLLLLFLLFIWLLCSSYFSHLMVISGLTIHLKHPVVPFPHPL